MNEFTLVDLVRAYFRAAFQNASPGEALHDPLPEEGGGPKQELVDLGRERLEVAILDEVSKQKDGRQFLKLLTATHADTIVLSMPVDEVMRPMFERMLQVAYDQPLVHEWYATWLMDYHRDDSRFVAVAASHYECAAILAGRTESRYREWADLAAQEVRDYARGDADQLLEEARRAVGRKLSEIDAGDR